MGARPRCYATIFSFAGSPANANVLWVGSDEGYVNVSRDDGKSWTKDTPPDLPEFALISIIEPSTHNAAEAYIAANRYELQDNRSWLPAVVVTGVQWAVFIGL